ncbi:MAG: response regulator transcription factor [Chthoniobacteraceae bacterium]
MKERVLLVGDYPLMRLGIAMLIRANGHYEICAETGEFSTARRLCQELSPAIIIMNADQQFASVPGILRDFTALSPRSRSMVISAFEDAASLQRVFNAGARGYVSKQEEPDEVLHALKRVGEGELFASRRVAGVLVKKMADGGLQLRSHPVSSLSMRETEVFLLTGAGATTATVAMKLGTSIKTVETYHKRIKEKLGLTGAADLRRRAEHFVRRHQSA